MFSAIVTERCSGRKKIDTDPDPRLQLIEVGIMTGVGNKGEKLCL